MLRIKVIVRLCVGVSSVNKYNLNKLFVWGCEKDMKGIEALFELELVVVCRGRSRSRNLESSQQKVSDLNPLHG